MSRGSAFTVTVPVRFSDLDVFGHVNHTSYLAFCEEHRTAFFDRWTTECGTNPLDGGFVVAAVHGDFRATLGPEIRSVEVAMTVRRIGTTSMNIEYDVRSQAVSCAVIAYTLVFVAPGYQPRPLNPGEREFLSMFLDPSQHE